MLYSASSRSIASSNHSSTALALNLGLSVRDQPVTIKRATWGGVSAPCEVGVVVVGNFASDVGRFLWRCAPPG